MAVSLSGDVYITGTVSGEINGLMSTGGSGIVVLRYDLNGSLKWTRVPSIYSYGSSSGNGGMCMLGNKLPFR